MNQHRIKELGIRYVALGCLSIFSLACKNEGPTGSGTSDARVYSLKLQYNSGVGISGTSVLIQTGSGDFSAISDNNGVATIAIPNSVSLPNYVVATANSPKIQPEAGTFPGGPDISASRTITCAPAPARVLTIERRLRHLGDDDYAGSENSQLQIRSEGTSLTYSFTLASVPASMPYGRLYARGVQEETRLKVNGTIVNRLGNSSPDGDLSLYNFQLSGNPSIVLRVGVNTLTIETGYRPSLQDWDDIEYCSMVLYHP